jgi:AcrR family transcriptional regulator
MVDVRDRIAAAALDLFTDRGYEHTTVDAIAERAGVARRTFFRYFRSKDDVIQPDHEAISGAVRSFFVTADHLDPVTAVCAAARIVFCGYVADREVSVQRYLLARSVPALRDRESASGTRYARLFGRYLRGRYGDGPDAELRAEVTAAAVIAAHNQVLRTWLRGRGQGDPLPALDTAFTWVCATLSGWCPGGAAIGGVRNVAGGSGTGDRRGGAGEDSGPATVVVFRSDQPWEEVVRQVAGSLRPPEAGDTASRRVREPAGVRADGDAG